MIPKVKDYDSPEREELDDYLKRWPQEYCNFPENVIENWVHRHNPQFISDWSDYNISSWVFELRSMSVEEIMKIEHLDGELDHWDYVGDTYINSNDPYQYLANYMRNNGTFPEPIIIAENANGIRHPKGLDGEFMKTPYQLIEGHRRLGFLRAMVRLNMATLKDNHEVWVISELS